MKTLSFLLIPIWANLVENGNFDILDLPVSPRYNETCDSLDSAELCEDYCTELYLDCISKCEDEEYWIEIKQNKKQN